MVQLLFVMHFVEVCLLQKGATKRVMNFSANSLPHMHCTIRLYFEVFFDMLHLSYC